MDIVHKVCSLCLAKKPLSDFYKNLTGPHRGKAMSRCKECIKRYQHEKQLRKEKDRIEGRAYDLEHQSRICSTCEVRKPFSEYRKRRVKSPLRAQCKECEKRRRWAYELEHPEKRPEYDVRRKYGMSLNDLSNLIKKQKNRCAACLEPFDKTVSGRPVVDHCHVTNSVRGIIHHGCNCAEGILKTPKRVLSLYKYMIRNELLSYSPHTNGKTPS